MTKSFRNLVLSLLLAAGAVGLAACEGTTGPAGVTGDSGPAGPAGPAGDAGKAGDSADEVLRSYAYLKTWGKTEGKAACADPVLKSTDAFPGPATLKTISPAPTAWTYLLTASGDLGNAGANPPEEGKCSNAVYAVFAGNNAAFRFMTTHGTAADNMTETKTGATTPVLKNRTLTEVSKQFREGDVEVMFNQGADELAERDLLFTRCDTGSSLSGSTLKGKFRVVKIIEKEFLLKTNTDTTTEKDTGAGSEVRKTTIKVCVRFSAPGTVKCYIVESAQKRSTSTDKVTGGASPTETVTEQIALYGKDGNLTQVDPVPDRMNRVPGGMTPASNANLFGAGFVTVSNPAKLCNFFAGGVIGTAAAASTVPSTGGGGGSIDLRAACETAGGEGGRRARGNWSSGSCMCIGDSVPVRTPGPTQGQCRCPDSKPRWDTASDICF